jgi:hypothetical protein
MSSNLQEQFGVANSAAHWDVEGFRLWQSTEPGIILYVARDVRLARDGAGRYNATLTQTQRWHGGAYDVTGGSAALCVFADLPLDSDAARRREDQWIRVVMNMGYKGSTRPRFLPLPVREVRLTVAMDASQGRVAEDSASKAESRSAVITLTSTGAREWIRAITDKAAISGGMRIAYTYPQMMPQVTATATMHGSRAYALLAAALPKAADGTLYGSAEDFRALWLSLVRNGAVEISVTDSPKTDSRTDLIDRLSDEAREQFFDVLFTPFTGSSYALRWRGLDDVSDFGMTIAVEGWTWLSASLNGELSALLEALDDSYIHATYDAVSVPVLMVVEPSPTVTTIAGSLDFGDVRAPEAPLFDTTGGTQQFLVSTTRPEAVTVTYRLKVNFKPANWPIVEAAGTAPLTADGFKVVVRPESWIRRHTVYMYVRNGSRIVPAAEVNPADYLTLTATYQAPYLASQIRTAARITQQGPIEFSYPVPPGAQPGNATLSAMGMIGGQLVRADLLDVHEADDALYLLVDGSKINLVGRNAVVSESDALVERLLQSNARPVVSNGPAPAAEDTRDLDVDVNVDVFLISQPTDVSCWAASLAMVVSARDSASTMPTTVAARAGMDVDTGYGWSDIRKAVSAWDLIEEGPRSAMPDEWGRLLKQWGPIWVVEVGAPYHAIVLAGLRGDGTPEGTDVTTYNPWPPGVGAIEQKTFLEFDREFGLGVGAGAAMVRGGRPNSDRPISGISA